MMEQIEKMDLDRMKRKIEEDRRKLKQEKEIFNANTKRVGKDIEKSKKLFEIQWKLLEGELKKLAAEKERFRKEKEFFKNVRNFEKSLESEHNMVSVSKLFFAGVNNEESLKKRYKDLMKIYHPDNLAGDSDIVIMINKEYIKMKELYAKK